MAKRNENVIVILLEKMPVNEEFIEWPLHITVVPWFHGYDETKLDKLLSQIAASHKKFKAGVGQLEKFGYKKDVEVNLIDNNKQLNQLHRDVFDILESNDFIIHQKDFVGEGYRAHITRQPHGYKNEGEEIQIKSLSLVKQERLKKSGAIVKKIVKQYELG